DLTIEEVQELLKMAKMFREDEYKLTKQIFVANLFFEPSTRTKTSFVVAERKLGLENLEFSTDTSSMKKDETLSDTTKIYKAIRKLNKKIKKKKKLNTLRYNKNL